MVFPRGSPVCEKVGNAIVVAIYGVPAAVRVSAIRQVMQNAIVVAVYGVPTMFACLSTVCNAISVPVYDILPLSVRLVVAI